MAAGFLCTQTIRTATGIRVRYTRIADGIAAAGYAIAFARPLSPAPSAKFAAVPDLRYARAGPARPRATRLVARRERESAHREAGGGRSRGAGEAGGEGDGVGESRGEEREEVVHGGQGGARGGRPARPRPSPAARPRQLVGPGPWRRCPRRSRRRRPRPLPAPEPEEEAAPAPRAGAGAGGGGRALARAARPRRRAPSPSGAEERIEERG
jgi:hypothetical protein